MAKILENKYKLKSKDKVLLEFNLYSKIYEMNGVKSRGGWELEITKVISENRALLPKEMNNPEDSKTLMEWIKSRKAPRNRKYSKNVLQSVGDSDNPLNYADFTYALSLNDAYWIENSMTPAKWDEINLYNHPLDGMLKMVAFTGYSLKPNRRRINSPEPTTNGAQKKCWENRNDGIYLIKANENAYPNTTDGRGPAVSEYMSSLIADVMEIDHVRYDLEHYKSHFTNKVETACVCKSFTSENEGFCNAATYFKQKGIDISEIDDLSPIEQHKLAKAFGKEKYADMMVFDAFVVNQDRHYGNFGYMVDNNTGEFLRPAPIFDNGASLFVGLGQNVFDSATTPEELVEVTGGLHCYTGVDSDVQLGWFVEQRHAKGFRKLLDFHFPKRLAEFLDPQSIDLLEKAIHSRAKRALEIYHEVEKSKALSGRPSVVMDLTPEDNKDKGTEIKR